LHPFFSDLRRSHHYKAERFAMRLIVATESGVVANNIVVIHRETSER